MRRAWRLLIWAAALLVLGRIGYFAVVGLNGLQWDTQQLARDNATLRACLAKGVFNGCEGSGHFPLIQHLPTFLLGALGLGEFGVVRVMAILSFLSFLGILMVGGRALASDGLRRTWLLLLATSPFLYYAQASFGEMLAAFLAVAFIASCWSGNTIAMVATAALTGVTKDFAPFVVGILGVLALWIHDGDWPPRRLKPVIAGVLVALALSAGFNFARFGVPWNEPLLSSRIMKVPLDSRVSFFFGLWYSPNGGMLFFWPIACLVLASLSGARDRRVWWSVLAILLVLTVGLSGWWAPFGWIAWGPRLLLPWVPACLLLLLRAYPSRFKDWLFSPWLLSAAIGLGYVQFCALYGYPLVREIFAAAPECPKVPMVAEADPAYYFTCMKSYVWDPRIRWDQIVLSAWGPAEIVFSLAYWIALGGISQGRISKRK